MANLTVFDVEEQTRVPYLRGILTRSLQNAGLSFPDAYKLASRIRKELGDASEITNDELRARVEAHLRDLDDDLADVYMRGSAPAEAITITSPDGETRPFSRGHHRLDLMSSGLSSEDAFDIVAEVYRQLTSRGEAVIEADDLREITRETIRRVLTDDHARRYEVWQAFAESDRPLLVLVGGTVGTGKSTVSTALGQRLGIVRIQSTDMLREVMRALVPESLLPALYKSTFTAWQAVPGPEERAQPDDHLLAEGYLTQAEPVSVANEAVVTRSLKERLSLILEGVHVHPAWLTQISRETDAIIVPIMLAVLSRKQLKKRIKGRGRAAPDRRAERYLKNLDAIWQLQSFLLSEADAADVPIVFNEDLEATVQQCMEVVIDALAEEMPGVAEPVAG